MSPLGYSESSATNDKAIEEVSGPNVETQTKSTNDPGCGIIDCIRFGQHLCLNAVLLKFTILRL